jgi:YidC/Oxa1 family membrane protein insertase
MVIAVLAAALILFGWPYLTAMLFPDMAAQQEAAQNSANADPAAARPTATGAPAVAAPARARTMTLAAALGATQRVQIESPRLRGSINLTGARIDDLVLVGYRQTVEGNAPPVRLFAPGGTRSYYFAGTSWAGTGLAAPAPDARWTAPAGARLTPTTPVTLSYDNGQGQIFQITYAVDESYMFSVTQRVTNSAAAPVNVQPYTFLSRRGVSPDVDTYPIHNGAMGVFNDAAEYINVDQIRDAPGARREQRTTGGWLGFTDHFWLGAIIPDQNSSVDTLFVREPGPHYQAMFFEAEQALRPGQVRTSTARIFAGAKEIAVLDAYTDAGIAKFDFATDWGWFRWFAKPIYYALEWLFELVKNFGVAIMLLTLGIRLLMFPIAQKQFSSMAAMRVVQPKLKALQDKFKDDKPRLQQAMMELYKTEKINPLAGCLPILIQIPIFYALYKVLMLSVEMRHQPFVGWIDDLSAPDKATFLNLFGYLDFTPPSLLAVGVLALLLGITMWAQFKLNPPSPDPIQAQMFAIMPWILMFVMAPFAAGLLIYWITNNILTIGQQKLLYARHPGMKQAMATPAK